MYCYFYPEGYQRHSISIEQWTEKCPDGWTDTGWFCTRPTKSADKKDSTCPSDYTDIVDDKCKKECEPGYEFKDENAYKYVPIVQLIIRIQHVVVKSIKNNKDYEIPYKYRIKKTINDYFKKLYYIFNKKNSINYII